MFAFSKVFYKDCDLPISYKSLIVNKTMRNCQFQLKFTLDVGKTFYTNSHSRVSCFTSAASFPLPPFILARILDLLKNSLHRLTDCFRFHKCKHTWTKELLSLILTLQRCNLSIKYCPIDSHLSKQCKVRTER